MNKIKRRRAVSFFLALCLVSLFFSALSVRAGAEGTALFAVTDKTLSRYQTVTVRVGGVSYVPLRAFGERVLGCRVTYASATRTLSVKATGLTLTATDGGYVTEANGRAFFSYQPAVILSDGRMYLPARLLAKIFGLSVSWSGASRTATLSGVPKFPEDGSTYYGADVLFWLSRIISAESRGEPLLGQIAVGRVVLNRVKSPDYPNTVWGVIFDRKYGVQFSPVSDGSIYQTPTASAVLAAKIALEGDVLTENVLFFLEPRKAQSLWIVKSRKKAYTIGNHDFYY